MALGLLGGCRDRARDAGGSSAASAAASASAPAETASAASAAKPAPSASAAPPAAKLPRAPLNVLLISVDSLRTDVPWLGYERAIAPNLTKLAADAVVYSHAYAGSSYTAKSVATLLAGRYPSTLYRDYRFFARYAASNRFFPELLTERGVRTFAWHGHAYFGRNSGFEQGFAEWKLVPGIKFDAETDNDVTSDKMTALGIELLGKPENTGGRFFGWAHYMDPHDQYLRHAGVPDFGKKARDRYDGEIFYADLWIGKLLDFARQKPWWQNTVVIVTADHGEAFGEHGMYKHAFEVWEVLARVPLLIFGPGLEARKIDVRRSHVDLAPTILELLGVPVPPDFQGKSLVPELFGADPEVREPILVELAEDSHNPPRRAIVHGSYKLIEFERGRLELYDLSRDPDEKHDVAAERPAELADMKQRLAERYRTLPVVEPYGGGKLREGGRAKGPTGPAE
ncbi:MAG TPA: sulfatase [Polyangiaceae bacterium]